MKASDVNLLLCLEASVGKMVSFREQAGAWGGGGRGEPPGTSETPGVGGLHRERGRAPADWPLSNPICAPPALPHDTDLHVSERDKSVFILRGFAQASLKVEVQ